MTSPVAREGIELLEARLPPEIEYEIFYLAFESGIRKQLNLLLVAKRVFDWLIPLRYKYLVINEWRHPSAQSFERYGHYIENLLVLSFYAEPKFSSDTILACCPNLRNLAFWDKVLLTERVFDLTKLTHLFTRSLTFFEPYYLSVLSQSTSGLVTSVPRPILQSFFSSITHLALYDALEPKTDPNHPIPLLIRILLAFTSLSHLMVYDNTPELAMSLALVHCPNIRVLVCLECTFTDGDVTTIVGIPGGDPESRVVYMDGHFTKDWKRGVMGGKDIWALADETIARRRGNVSRR